MDGQLEQVQGVLTELSRVEAGLAALRQKHGNTIYEVTTTAGMDAARAARVRSACGAKAIRVAAFRAGPAP